MKRLMLLTIALLVVGGGSAIAQEVRYDFDKDKDFTKYKTYKWVPIKGADRPDAPTAKQLTGAMNAEFAAKGLTETDSDKADLYIGFQTAIGTEKQFASYEKGWGYGAGWGGGWSGGGVSKTYGATIYIGQLDLSMYDSVQKQLVWRGVVSKALDPKANLDKKQKNITMAVQKLLKQYPPQAQ